MSSIAGLTTSLRRLTHDDVDDKVVFSEQLGGNDQLAFPVDGVNRTFRLKSAPLANPNTSGTQDATYVWVTIIGAGATVRSQSHTLFSVTDQVNGIITFAVAPNPGSAVSNAGVYVDYNFFWFTDAKYQEFLNQAANMTVAGVTDATQIAEGLVEPMLQYAIAYFWKARASQYAERYESTGGDASQRVQTVTQAYLALAKEAQSRGDYLKKDYYQRQGQRDLPSSQDGNVSFDPITPIR